MIVCLQVLCKSHYLELVEGGYGSSTDGDTCESTTDNNRNKNRKSKRNRTTFTDEQIHILQANFQIDCNPDGQDLERIADISGLSKRVVQVFIIVKLTLSFSSSVRSCFRFGSKTPGLAIRNTLVRRGGLTLAVSPQTQVSI